MPDTGSPWYLPYPALSDEADAPKYIQQLADANAAGLNLTGGGSPFCEASATSVQSMAPSAESAIVFQTSIVSQSGMFTNGGSVITVPQAGLYLILIGFSWQGNATGSRIVVLKINGATSPNKQWNIGGAGLSASLTGIIPTFKSLAAGNTVGFIQYQSSGVPLNTFTQAYPSLTVARLGPAIA